MCVVHDLYEKETAKVQATGAEADKQDGESDGV
jgi:hypothetical protein